MLKRLLMVLFFIAFLAKAYYLGQVPLYEDGTLYAVMISEEAEHLSFLPTYFGYPAPWKPGLYFMAYSLFLPVTSHLFNSIEWIYKAPNLLFGALSALLFYFIARRFGGSDFALACALLFYSSTLSLYVETRMLMEPFTLSLILLSLYFYTSKFGRWKFLAAGAAALLAALSKSVIAFMLIPLALAYAWSREKSAFKDPLFLLSLTAPLIGLAIFALALQHIGMLGEILFTDTGKHALFAFDNLIGSFIENLTLLFGYVHLMLPAAIIALLPKRKPEPFFAAWAAITILLLLSFEGHAWYYYYVLPAFAFFTADLAMEKRRLDKFAALLVSLFAIASISIFAVSSMDWESNNYRQLLESRQIGLGLAGEENTLIIGKYYTITTTLTYKTLEEKRVLGEHLPVGYIILISPYDSPELIEEATPVFVENYNADAYGAQDETFANLFWEFSVFRLKTNLTEFDCVVVSPPYPLEGYSAISEGNFSTVYKKD